VLTGYNKGDLTHSSTPKDIKTKCKSANNEMMFMIPYAQASITGELALDLLLAKGGVGLNVVLIKFSLPVTDELYKSTDTPAKAVGSCGGLTLAIEGLGGKIYAFLDLMKSVEIKTGGGCWFCFWKWEISRVWHRAFDFNFYEWSSPASWSSDTIKCKGGGLTDEVKEDPPMSCAWKVSGSTTQPNINGCYNLRSKTVNGKQSFTNEKGKVMYFQPKGAGQWVITDASNTGVDTGTGYRGYVNFGGNSPKEGKGVWKTYNGKWGLHDPQLHIQPGK